MAGPLGLRMTSADIGRMLLERDNDSEAINFSKSSGSNVYYAWEEKWNDTDEVVKKSRVMMSKLDSYIEWV